MATLEELDRKAVVDKLGLSVNSVFVPFSMSRNKNEKNKSLNWKVTIFKKYKGTAEPKEVITCDYSAGIAHCPSYTYGKMTVDKKNVIDSECETGFKYREIWGGHWAKTSKAIKPDSLDVIYSVIADCDVMNYGGFEDWAKDLGYNDDSIKAKKIFDTCIEIYLKMRNAIGEDGIKQLQEAFQDY